MVNDPFGGGAGPRDRLIAGAMSGTSADGVDVALVKVAGHGTNLTAKLLRHFHQPYPPDLRQAIFRIRETGSAQLSALARVGRDLSLVYAQAVNEALVKTGFRAGDLAAVAAHGQTLFHEPPNTIQWLDPALVAAEVGCAVVSDFRRADCAAGGQGAPLVPFADYILFRDPLKDRVLLNIGGIANLTYLPGGGHLEHVVAFDTGPGNCISDHLMRFYDPAGPGYDNNGAIASRGTPIYSLVPLMLSSRYFSRPAPKSTDGPAMVEVFRQAYVQIGRKFPFENLLKTACLLTATTIADAVRQFDPFPNELIVSGGGVHNKAIMDLLRQPLGDLPVLTTDDLGVPGQAKEAMAFAILASATLDGQPSNLPSATGARRPVVLGSVTPGGNDE
jgi:anhydro-N-acetylmuramic acid kinase